MKKAILLWIVFMTSLSSFAQRKTTNVRGYYRKDGTHVSPHTRHYNSGNRISSSRYSTSGLNDESEETIVTESDLHIQNTSSSKSMKKIDGIKVFPSTLTKDTTTTGVSIYIAVLRYNDTSVVDICPLSRSILTYDYDMSTLYFKIFKDKLKSEHTIELVSKYGFELKDDYLLKSTFMGTGRVDLPKYLTLRLEALTLR